MLWTTMKCLRGDAIAALDGRIGSLEDLYIDDLRWTVRYVVIDTGHWLPGRRVLLPPQRVLPAGPAASTISVSLTRDEVRSSPAAESDPPRPDLLEQARAQRYGNRSYWEGHVPLKATAAQFAAPFGGEHPDAHAGEKAARADAAARHCQLCSGCDLLGCSVTASDGDYGRIEDLVVDERDWTIAGVVVDTGGWLPGRKALLRPSVILHLDWEQRAVRVGLTQEEIERSFPAS